MSTDWGVRAKFITTVIGILLASVMIAMGANRWFGRYSEIAIATPFAFIVVFATYSFIKYRRGDASAVPPIIVREEDYLEEDEELKEEILRIMFPAKPLDEESPVLKATNDVETGVVGGDKLESADGGGDGGGDDSDVQCAICLEPIVPGDLIVSGASCDHAFHRPCVFQWLMAKKRRRDVAAEDDEHNTCPTCRSPMWTGQEYEKAEAEARANETDTRNKDEQNKQKKNERMMRIPQWVRSR